MTTGKVIGGSLGAIGILVLSQILAQALAGGLALVHVPEIICNIVASVLYLVFSYFLLKLFAKKFLKLSLAELGIPAFHIHRKWLVVAILLPSIVTGIYFLLPGQFTSSGLNGIAAASAIVTGICWVGIAAGFVEEMVFRGFILNLLDKKWGKKIAVFVPSALFGLVHILGMDFSLLSCLLVVLAGTCVGIMFSMIQQAHNSIWNSGIVHAIWNIITTSGILAVSSTAEPYSLWTYVLETDNFILTGGEFGIESSIIAVAGYLIVAVLAWRWGKRNELTQKLISAS